MGWTLGDQPFLTGRFLTQSPVPPRAWGRNSAEAGRGVDIADIQADGDAEMILVQLA
jgi:hypothetical protein